MEFDEEDLLNYVTDFVAGVAEWDSPHQSSIKKDVDCFLRMYATKSSLEKGLGDDLIDCPFRDLGLLRAVTGSHRGYRLMIGPKPGLPPEVALYASLDFLARTDSSSRSRPNWNQVHAEANGLRLRFPAAPACPGDGVPGGMEKGGKENGKESVGGNR